MLQLCFRVGRRCLDSQKATASGLNDDNCRHRVRYVAQTDLDELLLVNAAPSLLTYLNWLDRTQPMWASASWLSRRARVQVSRLIDSDG